VLWATGYDLEFGWVDVPMFGSANAPVHRRGVSAARGVYLLGLLRLHKFKSSFLCGVGEDAEYIAEHIHAAG
jgi:putative flavoprotein involved in K+ transport